MAAASAASSACTWLALAFAAKRQPLPVRGVVRIAHLFGPLECGVAGGAACYAGAAQATARGLAAARRRWRQPG
jgi:hypothetical protein